MGLMGLDYIANCYSHDRAERWSMVDRGLGQRGDEVECGDPGLLISIPPRTPANRAVMLLCSSGRETPCQIVILIALGTLARA